MSTVNGFQVGSETLKYNYESLDNYNTPNFSTSSSKTYAVGDYVMYNGKLYKCTTATTGGTWVSSSWTLAVLSDDVNDLSRHLSDVEENQIPELNNALTQIVETGIVKEDYDFEWEVGYINSSTGEIDRTILGWRVSKPINKADLYGMYITTPNALEVYAYNADDSYFGRRNNIPANSVNYQVSNTLLSTASYARILTTYDRSILVSAYIPEKKIVTQEDLAKAEEPLLKANTALFAENGFLDLTNNISIGGISGLGVVEPEDGRYLFTPTPILMNGDNISYLFTSNTFKVEACFYKENMSWWGRYPSTEQSGDTTFTVPLYLVNQYYVRFMFKPVEATNFFVTGIPEDIGIKIKIFPTEKQNTKINVLSYNLRCLRGFSNADPDSAPLTQAEMDNCIVTMSNYVGSFNPDLFIACEDRPWFDAQAASDITGGTKSVYEMLWKHWFPYKFDIEWGITVPRLYSKYPILYGRRQDVTYPSTPQSNRPISTVLISINNTPVWIIPVHATSDPTAYETDRKPYFQAIVDFCEDKDFVILAGDFNTDTITPSEELEVFRDAGFTLGNFGIFGEKKTYVSGAGYTMNRLDNIIVKGFTLNNFIVGTEEYSDHYPVFSNINIR